MNRKQFVLVLLALCIIGGSGLALFKRSQKTWNVREAKVGEYVFPDFKQNDIAAIHIKGKQDFRVVRTNGMWRVPARYNYPANFGQISELLLDLKKLKVSQSEIVGSSMRARVDLADPGSAQGAGQLIELENDKGKALYSLLLGRMHDRKQDENEPLGIHGWFDGRYVLLPGEPDNILLVPSQLPGAAPQPGGWLDHTFFKIENPKFIGLVSPDPANNWELSRETPSANWVLNGNPNEAVDREHLAQATEIWQFPAFVDLDAKTNVPPAEVGLDKPTVVTVVTFDNIAYTLQVGNAVPNGGRFVTVSVAGDFSAPRVAAPDETPEDKKRLDDEYEAHKKVLQEKVAKDRAYGQWVFLTEEWINVVMRKRSEMVAAKSPTQEASRN